jgi:hypothetical protein
MSSFMNASLVLASLSDYNSSTRSRMWPCIDLLQDSSSALTVRLQRLEMIGVVLVSVHSMVERLQSNSEKFALVSSDIYKMNNGSSLEFMQRHYPDVMSPQIQQERNAHVVRRIVTAAVSASHSADCTAQVMPEIQSNRSLSASLAGVHLHAADDASLESARSSCSAGDYFADPSVIVIPSGSAGSASIPLRLNVAGRHEQQVGFMQCMRSIFCCIHCIRALC